MMAVLGISVLILIYVGFIVLAHWNEDGKKL